MENKKYWYPSMEFPEIIFSLKSWGLEVTSQQLAKPNPDFVMKVYTSCVQQVTGVAREDLDELLEAAIASLDEATPDIYTNSLSLNFLVYHITRFANVAKVHDFSAKDLCFPERERTRSILSAFINFIRFSEQCIPFVMSLREKSASLNDERAQAEKELAEIQRKVSEIKARRAQDEPKSEELRRENAAITAHLIATKESQVVLLKDIESLKAEKSSLLQRKEGLNSDTALASDTLSRTRSRIVQSPERIKRTITTMGATANEDKKTLGAQETKTRDLQAKISALLNIEKDIRACVEQLQTIEKEVRALEISQKELGDTKDHLDEKKIERTELEMRRERVRKQLSNAHEKLERAQRHVEDKRLASQQTIERLQQEYEEMSLERRDNDKQVEELRREADETDRKASVLVCSSELPNPQPRHPWFECYLQMADHLRRSEAEINELLAEYWGLRHETGIVILVVRRDSLDNTTASRLGEVWRVPHIGDETDDAWIERAARGIKIERTHSLRHSSLSQATI
ncbi:hypothetical protein EVG20_g5406 [Dentipellis fragilis]|uniref:Uncharacterized protein n=1 Tax=Dentipellis fragilis TaxID=205917 RepID=A0A4Y9YTH5_9AGAM|nr:hypothetical protein EVG20_g5406 [Dentipellis fragilis]